MGVVHFREPMLRLFNQGIILGPDGNRMSKSRGNVVAPDDYVEKYGADTVRAYLMFIGPWDTGGPWNFTGIEGVKRFLERVWTVVTEPGRHAAASDEDPADGPSSRTAPHDPQNAATGHRGYRGVQVQHGRQRIDGVQQLPDQGARDCGVRHVGVG